MIWDGWMTMAEFRASYDETAREAMFASALRNLVARNCRIARVRLK